MTNKYATYFLEISFLKQLIFIKKKKYCLCNSQHLPLPPVPLLLRPGAEGADLLEGGPPLLEDGPLLTGKGPLEELMLRLPVYSPSSVFK